MTDYEKIVAFFRRQPLDSLHTSADIKAEIGITNLQRKIPIANRCLRDYKIEGVMGHGYRMVEK